MRSGPPQLPRPGGFPPGRGHSCRRRATGFGPTYRPSTHLVATIRLTGASVEAEQSGAAPQAGSAPQPGSQQPLPASQPGSQQLEPQQLAFRHFFAAWIAFRRSRMGVCFFRTLQQPAAAPQLGSQQPAPASQAGSQQPLPASQAGSAQPLPAPQAGSQQPFPASQAGSQQLSPQQLLCFRLHFSNRPFRPPNRSCFFRHFRAPQQPAPASQQPAPASQAGSQQPLPASQAGSAHPLPAPQPGSQQPAPASQPGSQHEAPPLQPSIRSRSSKPKDWLQTVTLRTSAPRYIIRFIEPHLLCL
jgi:hypothetical protein